MERMRSSRNLRLQRRRDHEDHGCTPRRDGRRTHLRGALRAELPQQRPPELTTQSASYRSVTGGEVCGYHGFLRCWSMKEMSANCFRPYVTMYNVDSARAATRSSPTTTSSVANRPA